MHVCAECGERAPTPGLCPRDAQPLVAATDPLLGEQLGRYRIARAIAGGGMGRVYLGVQPEIGSRVAIKVLSETCAEDPELVERFFAEARAVNLIAHENIINVIDLATLEDGRPYIVMEHVDGVTLTRATAGGRAPLGGIVHVFLDVLSALGAAHAIGIVHRDLKPDNVMITAKGHAKVLDFGIAKLSPQQQPFAGMRTVTGALLGTPAYMAPEQIANAGAADARSDIYAAGAVLFHAVTGRPPFGGATMFDIMRAQLEELPPAPRGLRPDLPLEMERVIMRALAKEPAVRFATAAEMAAALDEAAASLPDHQWFDLSPRTTPMRVRGSGPRTRHPQPAPRETPPAISVVSVPEVVPPAAEHADHRDTPSPASAVRRLPLVVAGGAAIAAITAVVVVALARRTPSRAIPPVAGSADDVAHAGGAAMRAGAGDVAGAGGASELPRARSPSDLPGVGATARDAAGAGGASETPGAGGASELPGAHTMAGDPARAGSAGAGAHANSGGAGTTARNTAGAGGASETPGAGGASELPGAHTMAGDPARAGSAGGGAGGPGDPARAGSAGGGAGSTGDAARAGDHAARGEPAATAPKAKPGARLAVVPTKPYPVAVDLGRQKTNLSVAATYHRALAIATMLPGVQTAQLLAIQIGGGIGSRIDATQGGWVTYRFVLDPPPDEGCHGIVAFGERVTVHVRRGSCTEDRVPRLPRCELGAAWAKVIAAHPTERVPSATFRWAGTWDPDSHHATIADDCP